MSYSYYKTGSSGELSCPRLLGQLNPEASRNNRQDSHQMERQQHRETFLRQQGTEGIFCLNKGTPDGVLLVLLPHFPLQQLSFVSSASLLSLWGKSTEQTVLLPTIHFDGLHCMIWRAAKTFLAAVISNALFPPGRFSLFSGAGWFDRFLK